MVSTFDISDFGNVSEIPPSVWTDSDIAHEQVRWRYLPGVCRSQTLVHPCFSTEWLNSYVEV